MIRKDLRTAIEMNRLETFTAHSLASLLAASNEEQAKWHRQNASTLLYELAKRGEVVCVGREGLLKVYRKARAEELQLARERAADKKFLGGDKWTKKQMRQMPPKTEPEPTTSPAERIARAKRHLTESEPDLLPKVEPTTDPGSPSPGALTDVQIGRAMINLVAQLERNIVGLNSRVAALSKEKQLLQAEHHRQLDLKEQALRAAQDTIKQLEHKLQQATLIRRPANGGGAPLTMAIGKLLDSAGAGR